MTALFFHELMDGIKKPGDFLDLVDNNRPGLTLSSYQVKQGFRARSEAPENVGFKKIYYQRLRKS